MTRPAASPQGHARSSEAAPASQPPNLLPAPAVPSPPAHLGPVGAAVWADVWAAGGRAYNPVTDHYTIERYANLQERRHRMIRVLEGDGTEDNPGEGYLTVGSQGQFVAHPLARLLEGIEGRLLPLEDRLGLSPEARIRLGIGAMEHKSKLDQFREKGREQG